jgi:glutaredoxin
MTPAFFCVLLIVSAGAPVGQPAKDPLEAAKRLLAQGKLDEVLFEIEDAASKAPGAVDVLAEAGRQSVEKNDQVLALQFAQRALRFDARHPLALEVGSRACLAQQQFDPAEQYSDRLIALDQKAARPRLLRAEISLEQGEWSKVLELTRPINPSTLSREDLKRLEALVQTSGRELRERADGMEKSRELQRQLDAELQRLKTAPPPPAPEKSLATTGPVIIYGTSWCGFCRAAAGWFKSRKIAFVEKDIEKDPAAAAELIAKATRAKRSGSGVPWIDVGGKLIQGFDKRALEELFP